MLWPELLIPGVWKLPKPASAPNVQECAVWAFKKRELKTPKKCGILKPTRTCMSVYYTYIQIHENIKHTKRPTRWRLVSQVILPDSGVLLQDLVFFKLSLPSSNQNHRRTITKTVSKTQLFLNLQSRKNPITLACSWTLRFRVWFSKINVKSRMLLKIKHHSLKRKARNFTHI